MHNDFPFAVEMAVRFRDVDALGHVNNAVYFSYMENARIHFFAQFFDVQNLGNVPVILGETSCRFISSARFGETLRVALGVSRFGNKSFDLAYRIEGGDGRLVARGRSTQVMYDYEAEESIPIPASFKQQVQELQGEWQPPL
jgi:acyl-CoA thioester hydrolase